MRPKLVVITIIIAGIAWFVLDLLQDSGQFKTLEPHFNGAVVHVAGPIGAEDITINPKTGVAYISSDDRRNWFQGNSSTGPSGAIYAYNLEGAQPELRNLTPELDFIFHPHGISLFVDAEEKQTIFVVNHRPTGHFIEIFDVVENELRHKESISGELLSSPNNILAVDERRFYATIDHGNTSKIGRTLEDYLRLERARVVYFDGTDFKVVADGLLYANGINMSPNGNQIYVAATTSHKLHIYRRNIDTGALTPDYEIDCNTGIDNIELDAAGNLWIGAHPKLLTFVQHAKDDNTLSPSEVLKVSLLEDGNYQAEQVFLSLGDDLSASSVAAVYKNKLLIGAVFDDGFLVCTLPEHEKQN